MIKCQSPSQVRISCVLTCVWSILSCHCTSLGNVWLCSLPSHSVTEDHDKISLCLLWTTPDLPASPPDVSCHVPQSLDYLGGPLLFSLQHVTLFLFWDSQNWTQLWVAAQLWIKGEDHWCCKPHSCSMHLVFLAARAHCRLRFNLVSSRTSKQGLLTELLPS